MLLVDASNAFKELKRHLVLLNVCFECPAMATFLTKFYRKRAKLFVDGEVLS